jgi:hypothetical protein
MNNFFRNIMARTSNIQWNDDEVHFVPDQRTELDVFLVLAHWNNSLLIDMSLQSDTLLWYRANQSLLFLLNAAVLSEEATNTNCIVFDLVR